MVHPGRLGHVLWLGGPPGAGKTSVATRLARRHGLRLYSADTQTWRHRDRAVGTGHRLAAQWDAMTPAERWDGWSADELVALTLHAERGPMVVDDLSQLPSDPLVIAEGSTLPAAAVTDGIAERDRAIWMLPTAKFQARVLDAARLETGPAALYRLLRDDAEREVAEHDLPVLRVDGARGVAETVRLVEERFAAVLAAGPRADSLAARRALLREANVSRADQVRGWSARQPPTDRAAPGELRATFLCECGDGSCEADVAAGLAVLDAGVLVAPGHG